MANSCSAQEGKEDGGFSRNFIKIEWITARADHEFRSIPREAQDEFRRVVSEPIPIADCTMIGELSRFAAIRHFRVLGNYYRAFTQAVDGRNGVIFFGT